METFEEDMNLVIRGVRRTDTEDILGFKDVIRYFYDEDGSVLAVVYGTPFSLEKPE